MGELKPIVQKVTVIEQDRFAYPGFTLDAAPL